MGPAYQRLCHHSPRLDWLAGVALPLRLCLKGVVPTAPHACPSHTCPSTPPRHFLRASPNAGRVTALPPFTTPPPSAELLAAALLPPTVAHAASSLCAGRRARSEPSTAALLPFRRLAAWPRFALHC
jgi:hypothetical protein